MEHTLNHGMCRCCASEGMFKNFSATYQWMGADEVYSDMLKECFDIALTHAEDCNNGGICEVCITQLRNASNFKKQVLQTEEQFKKMVQDNLFKTNIVKVENSKDEDELESEPDNLSDPDYSGTEFEVPVKEEVIEPKTRKRAAKASTSSAKKAKTEDGEPSRTRTNVHQKSGNNLSYPKAVTMKEVSSGTLSVKKLAVPKRLPLKGSAKTWKKSDPPERVRILRNVLEVFQGSNATPFQYNSKGYSCYFCDDQYSDPISLKKHTSSEHVIDRNAKFMKTRDISRFYVKVDITDLSCKICSKSIDNLQEMMDHLYTEHSKKLFMDAKLFMVPFKFDSDVLRCFICLNKTSTFKVLLEHMNTHCRNFVCEVCHSGFITRTGLVCHSKIHATGKFSCLFCNKEFVTLQRKSSHEKYVHGGVMLNRCSYCTDSFRDYNQKLKHLIDVHGITPYTLKCHACDRNFTNQKSFRNHTKRHHLVERRHSCSECEMKFYSTTELKDHMIKHTGERKFQCAVCLKAYGRKSTLREHMRIHDDDRRFKCEHCGMAFVQRCSWRGHMRAKHAELV